MACHRSGGSSRRSASSYVSSARSSSVDYVAGYGARSASVDSRSEATDFEGCGSPSPTSGRYGYEIPGYSGFVPRVRSGNIHGKTFREQNVHASRSESFEPGASRRAASQPALAISGYTGCFPGASENVVGLGRRDAHARQLAYLSGDRPGDYQTSSRLQDHQADMMPGRAGAEIPHYTGHIPGVRSESHEFGASKRIINDRAYAKRGLPTTQRSGDVLSQAGREGDRAWRVEKKDLQRVMSGYAGHIPGSAENVVGKNHLEEKSERYAALGLAPRRRSKDPRTPRGPPIPRGVDEQVAAKRMAVAAPGYAGHVPGKHELTVVGKTSVVANQSAVRERFHPEGQFFRGGGGRAPRSRASSCDSRSEASSWAGAAPPGRGFEASLAGSSASISRRRTMPGESMRELSADSLASSRTESSYAASSAFGGRRAKQTGSAASSDVPSTRSGASASFARSNGRHGPNTTVKLAAPRRAR